MRAVRTAAAAVVLAALAGCGQALTGTGAYGGSTGLPTPGAPPPGTGAPSSPAPDSTTAGPAPTGTGPAPSSQPDPTTPGQGTPDPGTPDPGTAPPTGDRPPSADPADLSSQGWDVESLALRPDPAGNFTGTTELTNTEGGTRSAVFTFTVYVDGELVSTLLGSLNAVPAGDTAAGELISVDTYVAADYTIGFTVDITF